MYIQGQARGSAKLIVLTFTLTDRHPYSITGQLNGAGCDFPFCSKATAKLTSETGTIFEVVGTTLSESGTLLPGNYTLSVDVYAAAQGITTYFSSDANFAFALDGPVSTPTPTPTPIPVTRATNLSTRLFDGTREVENGIGGFIITGTRPEAPLNPMHWTVVKWNNCQHAPEPQLYAYFCQLLTPQPGQQ